MQTQVEGFLLWIELTGEIIYNNMQNHLFFDFYNCIYIRFDGVESVFSDYYF